MLRVTCTKGINCDYYKLGNDSIPTYETDRLKETFGNYREQDIDWERGRNVFAGRPLNDREFNDMVVTALEYVKQEEN